MALITTAFVVFAVGMMLFGFVFLNQSEVGFAAFNRNSTQALGLAEAGIQEAVKRVSMFGVPPNTCTTNSLSACPQFTASLGTPTTNGTGTVYYMAGFQNNPGIFPILSAATFAGVQRTVRILEQAVYKTGFGNTVFGPLVAFSGNSWDSTGDMYSMSSISYQQYQKSPPCATAATATNLVSPQVVAGTTLSSGNGPGVTEPCTGNSNKATGPFSAECTDGSVTEVAPTACTTHGGRSGSGNNSLPPHWHPMVPAGMGATDFTVVITVWNGNNTNLPALMQVNQATQGGTGVTYSPVTYTPSYWTGVPVTNGKAMVIYAPSPFCVKASTNQVQASSGGACPSGFNYYGSATGGTRFVDWSLVSDDLTRAAATKFFQPPTCSTCNGGSPNGNQNGIRYVPLLPAINVTALACLQNISPGTNVFDNAINDPAITCTNPPTVTHSSTSENFTGTKTNPEFLVIDNGPPGGTSVSISGSGTGGADCTSNPDSYSWGVILATGDLSFTGNTIFTGFIYTPGTISTAGTVVFRGGVYAANTIGTTAPGNSINSTGNAKYCAGSLSNLPLNSQFFTFSTSSWQDRPLNQR